jgi:hypothetical protein
MGEMVSTSLLLHSLTITNRTRPKPSAFAVVFTCCGVVTGTDKLFERELPPDSVKEMTAKRFTGQLLKRSRA